MTTSSVATKGQEPNVYALPAAQIAGFGHLIGHNAAHRGFVLTPCGEGDEECRDSDDTKDE